MHWIFAHFIGDYLIQTDWMAQNKKKSDFACIVHVVTYMVPFLLCGFAWWQLLLIAAQHYLIDRTGFVRWFMEVKGTKQFRDGPHAPWSSVINDNLLHILWIAFVAWLPVELRALGII
jgi:hypothetical protein